MKGDQPGEVVTYEFLTGQEEIIRGQDDKHLVRTGQKVFPRGQRVPTRDRIWDRYKKEFVDIGVYDPIKTREHPSNTGRSGDSMIPVTRTVFLPNAMSGKMGLTGGNILDEELYEFMEISNFNESFEDRDKSITPMWKRLDPNKEAKKRVVEINHRYDALKFVRQMTSEDIKEFAAAMGWNENAESGILEGQINEFADGDAKGFLKFVQEATYADKAIIKVAASKGIISYDTATHKVVWPNGQVIAALDKEEGKDWLTLFVEWLNTSTNGLKIMQNIKGQVGQKGKGEKKEVKQEELKQEEVTPQ